jgi:acyl-CoA thioesterase II
MSYTLHNLLDLLDLEPLEQDLYRGQNRDIGSGRVYGGQVLAQALIAAGRTVEPDRIAHSLHGYFILPGDLTAPIVYFVDRLRDGKSFSTRRVTAIQHGKAIFNLSASFHREEEGPEHQGTIPDLPPPEEVPREIDLIRMIADRIPEPLRAIYTQERPIEFRPIEPVDPFHPRAAEPLKHAWLKAAGQMPADLLQHQAVLAYASDYGLLGAALLPHALSFRQPHVQAATLDHAMWFHRRIPVDEWLLYSMESPSAAGARGFTRGSIFTRDGVLVASVAQEGLVRVRR